MFFRSLTTHTLTNSHICSPVCALCCYALSHDKNSKIERGKRRWRQMNDGVAIGASNQTAETILGYGLMASEHIEQCRLCAKNSKMNAKSTFTANGTKIASKNRNRSVILSHSLSLHIFSPAFCLNDHTLTACSLYQTWYYTLFRMEAKASILHKSIP